MTTTGINVGGGALASGLFVALAGAAFLGLSWLATPNDFNARLAHADGLITSAEAVLNKAHQKAEFPASAVCSEGVDAGAASLKARVQSISSQFGLTISNLTTAPASAPATTSTLSPVALQVEVTGRYDEVLALLASLSHGTPTIFVDSADLTSQVSSVDLNLTGRIYCSLRR